MLIYVISKLFTYTFLPPGIIIIILFASGILAKKLKWLFIISAILLWIVSTTPGKNLLLAPLENIKTDNSTADAVVVLTGGSNPNDIFKASPDSFKREIYGFILAKKNNLPLILSGGGISTNDATNLKQDLTIVEKTCNCNVKILIENKSLNTLQNAKNTGKLFKKLKIPKNILLVTSAYHIKRATMAFKYFGFKVHPKPIGFLVYNRYIILDFLPQMKNLYQSYKAIHEYLGIISLKLYTLLTTLKKSI